MLSNVSYMKRVIIEVFPVFKQKFQFYKREASFFFSCIYCYQLIDLRERLVYTLQEGWLDKTFSIFSEWNEIMTCCGEFWYYSTFRNFWNNLLNTNNQTENFFFCNATNDVAKSLLLYCTKSKGRIWETRIAKKRVWCRIFAAIFLNSKKYSFQCHPLILHLIWSIANSFVKSGLFRGRLNFDIYSFFFQYLHFLAFPFEFITDLQLYSCWRSSKHHQNVYWVSMTWSNCLLWRAENYLIHTGKTKTRKWHCYTQTRFCFFPSFYLHSSLHLDCIIQMWTIKRVMSHRIIFFFFKLGNQNKNNIKLLFRCCSLSSQRCSQPILSFTIQWNTAFKKNSVEESIKILKKKKTTKKRNGN